MPAQISGNGQQQWTTTRNDNALTFNRQASLYKCLQTARTQNIRQGPTWKRQKTFARSGRKNQAFVTQLANTARSFSQERLRRGLLKYTRAVDELNINGAKFLKPRMSLR